MFWKGWDIYKGSGKVMVINVGVRTHEWNWLFWHVRHSSRCGEPVIEPWLMTAPGRRTGSISFQWFRCRNNMRSSQIEFFFVRTLLDKVNFLGFLSVKEIVHWHETYGQVIFLLNMTLKNVWRTRWIIFIRLCCYGYFLHEKRHCGSYAFRHQR